MKNCTIEVLEQPEGLTINVAGRIDTTNAADFGAALTEARAAHAAGSVTIDLTNLDYISSAGLRELLKLQKGEAQKVKVTGPSPEVYDIFETTGFSQILDVHRRVEEFSIDGLEQIGHGMSGVVYRVDDETIIKVANASYPLEYVESERKMSQTALVSGLPTAIPFQTVKVGDSFGALYELVDSDSMGKVMMADPSCAAEMGAKLGRVARKLATTKVDTSALPDAVAFYRDRACDLSTYMSEEDTAAIVNAYDLLPACDTYVHRDLNFGNVLVQGDELILIDMGELSYGHPLIDLGGISAANEISYMLDPTSAEKAVGVSPEIAAVAFKALKEAYFDGVDAERLELLGKLITGYGVCKVATSITYRPYLTEEMRHMLAGAIHQMMPLIQAIPQLLPLFEMPTA